MTLLNHRIVSIISNIKIERETLYPTTESILSIANEIEKLLIKGKWTDEDMKDCWEVSYEKHKILDDDFNEYITEKKNNK